MRALIFRHGLLQLLYRWLKFLTGREGESEVMSFSQDFRDSTVLIEVLNKIFPRLQAIAMPPHPWGSLFLILFFC